MFFYSVQQGAERNELQENLLGLSDMYSRQAQTGQSRLQALMLPVLLVVVGVFVGMVIVSLFLPLISVLQAMEGGR